MSDQHQKTAFAIVAAMAGFAANLAQVSLFRFFMGNFYGTELHLGLFLAIWLAGISIGGIFAGKYAPGIRLLFGLILTASLFSFWSIWFGYKFFPSATGGYLDLGSVVLFMLVSIFPVSFLEGMLLPSLIKISQQNLGIYYGYEATGGFLGGIFFSFILGGTAPPFLCLLSVPIILFTCLIVLSPGKLKGLIIIFAIVVLIYYFGPKLNKQLEENYWKLTSISLELEKTVETPYQKLQQASYHEQKSLYSNGMLIESWPLTEQAEQRVHTFVSALKNFDNILLIGAAPPDVINEFIKYENLSLTLIELDKMVTHLFGYKGHKRLTIINEDPRSYLKRSKKLYDGIMIYPVSPVTLAGNRLFTFEALESMKARLRPDGVLSLQVSGAENYLGPLKEQIILSPWQALGKIFPYRYAVPGSSITFFACQNEGIIPKDVEGYISRFDRRKISTTTFLPMSFYNILQPFRVEELNNWLARPVEAKLNTDAHPESFIQQLELWNIYSGAQINRQLEKLQSISFKQLITFIAGAGLIFLLAMFLTSPIISLKTCVAAGVSVSGATGLLCEIILILLYQNSNGAAYQMSAFFFGVYMFGLAFGAWLFGQIRIENTALKRLKVVKFLQVLFTLLCVVFVSKIEFHNALTIGTAIFIIAFLDGIEFPVADSLFRSTKTRPQTSAGILMFSDNLGALLAGLASGLWLLPTYGMKASFYLLGFMLSINLLFLFILHRRISF